MLSYQVLVQEVLETFYTPMLIPSKGEYDPLVRCKIGASTPIWVVDDKGTRKGDFESVVPGSQVCPVISFDKIWYMAPGRFGVTLRCQGLICHPKAEQKMEDLSVDEPMDVDP